MKKLFLTTIFENYIKKKLIILKEDFDCTVCALKSQRLLQSLKHYFKEDVSTLLILLRFSNAYLMIFEFLYFLLCTKHT